jgi:hypothetical protein
MIDIATGQKLTAILRKRPRRAYQAMLGQGLVNQAIYFRLFLACLRTKRELCSLYVLKQGGVMLRVFVEEAAALASIGLFVGMIAIWAQVIPNL